MGPRTLLGSAPGLQPGPAPLLLFPAPTRRPRPVVSRSRPSSGSSLSARPPACLQAPPSYRPLPSPRPPIPSPHQRAVRGGGGGGGGAETGLALRRRARTSRGGASGGAHERLPAVCGGGPAGLRNMKVSPAAAGREVPAPRVPAPAPSPLTSSAPFVKWAARVRAGGAALDPTPGVDERVCVREDVGAPHRVGSRERGWGAQSVHRCGRACGNTNLSGSNTI